MSEIVGIDLGTTNSLIAVFRNGRPQLISNVHGETLTPSVVGVLPSGEVIVGSPAKELRVTEPHRCAATFKRLMGQNQSLKLGEKSFTAPELSAMVLRSLKSDAETFLGETVSEAVITVPAYFNDHQRKATRLAGELAGLKVRRIVNEPTAAALAYGFHDRQARKKLLVIDLGGGTFDVTLMDVFEGALEIISTAGENFLGGEDFTDRLASAALSSRNLQFEVMEQRHPLMVSRLRGECEAAKRILSTHETAAIRIPDLRGILDSDSADFIISRSAFTEIVRPMLDRLRGPIDKALRDGRCDRHEVDEVILAGGATRMPAVADLVRDDFCRVPCCNLNPDEVVALGAAVQAALIVDDVAVEDVVMTDICPHTLGVAIVKQFGGHLEEGFFSPVIHRNTTIPVSREERYATVHPHQTSIVLEVYQGEARRVKDNLLLGQLTVDGIPPGP
ncbi:MAG: molecular chaperone HscC, partial [Planctomycetota bacterium]|nr:molecular chaperone HscC [Planctomycetota bacterium]